MRILTGDFKGKTISAPASIRPTSSKVKLALFNICQNRIEGARFLDIFAGSGGIGFEALSRGAASVLFIENRKESLIHIKKNISLLGVEDRAKTIFKDAALALKSIKMEPFDIIFIDPPYAIDQAEEILNLILEKKLLKEDGVIFFETREKIPSIKGLESKERIFGDTRLVQLYFLK